MARGRARSGMRDTVGLLGIRDAAREVGVSPSALRVWERQGLLSPPRTPGGARRYRPEDIRRIREIHRLRTVEGLNAAAITRWLTPRADDGSVPGGGDAQPSARARSGRHDGHEPAGGDGWAATGERLRSMRRRRGLTLREAAARSGLSLSFVSAVERGASGASLIALRRLVEACGCTLAELLDGDGGRPETRHVRPEARHVLDSGRGIRIENLALAPSSLEPQLFVLQPGASSEGTYAHAGEEFMFVLSGEIRVWIGHDETYHLASGDALTYPSTIPHRFEAVGEDETRLIWVNTPPTF